MTDEEALAAVMEILEHIAAKALAGFKDEMDESTALSDIHNLARDTIKSLSARKVS